jgi:hypothetical protein
MEMHGSYWLGLTDIHRKSSGLEWTDASPVDYSNWEYQSNNTGKCVMIKRLEDPKVSFTRPDGW